MDWIPSRIQTHSSSLWSNVWTGWRIRWRSKFLDKLHRSCIPCWCHSLCLSLTNYSSSVAFMRHETRDGQRNHKNVTTKRLTMRSLSAFFCWVSYSASCLHEWTTNGHLQSILQFLLPKHHIPQIQHSLLQESLILLPVNLQVQCPLYFSRTSLCSNQRTGLKIIK